VKAKLSFKLPEEQNEFEISAQAMDQAVAWSELREWVRTQLKCGGLSSMEQVAMERVRGKILSLHEDYRLPEPT
jgi:hypothetical protein